MEAKIVLPSTFDLEAARKEIRMTIEEIKTGIGHHNLAAASLSIQNVRAARLSHEAAANALQSALLAAQLVEDRLSKMESTDGC